MSRTKLIATVSLAVAIVTMITSNQSSIYASPTTEDDGYTYPDDATEEEKDEIDEREQEAWEDVGRPGEIDDDDNSDNGDNKQIFTCSDGSTVTEDEECPPTGPNPYCDTEKGKAAPVCHDRKDYDQDTGLYPCNDGTNKVDWRDCKDVTENDGGSDSNTAPTLASPAPRTDTDTITQPINATAEAEAEEAACEAIGMKDGKQIPLTFSKEKWAAACGLMDQSYWYGFIDGCAQQVGYTEVKCIRFVRDVMEKTFH